jgi:hypothetical protein
MYTPEAIQARLREKPFRPLRIIASEGMKFDIFHPDLVLVGRHDVMIGSPGPDNPTVYDRVTRVALVHIVALEELPIPASPGNGQQG